MTRAPLHWGRFWERAFKINSINKIISIFSEGNVVNLSGSFLTGGPICLFSGYVY
jgi:hypothetical protein